MAVLYHLLSPKYSIRFGIKVFFTSLLVIEYQGDLIPLLSIVKGSVLGPTFFFLFTNDLFENVYRFSINFFPDDNVTVGSCTTDKKIVSPAKNLTLNFRFF